MLIKKLIDFELKIKKVYENGTIKAPIHLSGNNEKHLIEIFKKIKRTDWVFSTWRNHYHALLHGVDETWLYKEIISGRSMGIISKKNKFYSSAIVGGILPIALGVAMANKMKKSKLSKNHLHQFFPQYLLIHHLIHLDLVLLMN